MNLLSAYEELQQIPDEERITRLAPGAFGYCLDPDVPDEQLHTVYQRALSALELESDKIQEAGTSPPVTKSFPVCGTAC